MSDIEVLVDNLARGAAMFSAQLESAESYASIAPVHVVHQMLHARHQACAFGFHARSRATGLVQGELGGSLPQ